MTKERKSRWTQMKYLKWFKRLAALLGQDWRFWVRSIWPSQSPIESKKPDGGCEGCEKLKEERKMDLACDIEVMREVGKASLRQKDLLAKALVTVTDEGLRKEIEEVLH